MSVSPTVGHARRNLDVPADRLLEQLGCPSNVAPSRRTLRHIDEAIERVLVHAVPRGTYRTYPMTIEGHYVRVPPSVTLRSRRLAQATAPCHTICVFVVTLGGRIDRLVAEAVRERPHVGVVLDAAASVAADAMADDLESTLARALPEGEAVSWRFSPGYCDWSLREQRKLFSLLPDRPAGITLTPDCLMIPRKSVSGVIGVGPKAELQELGSPCLSCGRIDCDHRRM
jgi:hypothetical protein